MADDNDGAAAAASAADMTGGDAAAAAAAAAGAGGGGDQGGGEAQGGADPDWYNQVSAEANGEEPSLRDWAKSRGYKTLDEVLKSARDNQVALRDSGRVKPPGEGATAEETAAWRKAIGVPDEPAGYKMPVIKGEDGEPIAFNTGKLEGITKIAHKNGIPAAALEATLQEIAEADLLEAQTAEAEIQSRATAHAKKWGADEARKTADVGKALTALGLTRDEALAIRAAITPERALDIFSKLGAGLGEDTMVEGGERKTFGISGAEAQKVLDTKRADDAWREKALIAGTAENAEYKRLNAAIGEAANRKAAMDAAA